MAKSKFKIQVIEEGFISNEEMSNVFGGNCMHGQCSSNINIPPCMCLLPEGKSVSTCGNLLANPVI